MPLLECLAVHSTLSRTFFIVDMSMTITMPNDARFSCLLQRPSLRQPMSMAERRQIPEGARGRQRGHRDSGRGAASDAGRRTQNVRMHFLSLFYFLHRRRSRRSAALHPRMIYLSVVVVAGFRPDRFIIPDRLSADYQIRLDNLLRHGRREVSADCTADPFPYTLTTARYGTRRWGNSHLRSL